jgi:hypothetical protein
MKGVLHAMFATKVKIAATVMLGVALLAGAGTYGYGKLNAGGAGASEPAQADAKKSTLPVQTEKDKPIRTTGRSRVLGNEGKPNKKIMELMRKRFDAAKTTWNARADAFLAGKIKVTPQELIDASERLTKAQQDMTDIAADQLRILESRFDRMTKVHKRLEQLCEGGDISMLEVTEAAFALYDAEIALERFKAKLPEDGAKGEVTKSLFEGIEFDK